MQSPVTCPALVRSARRLTRRERLALAALALLALLALTFWRPVALRVAIALVLRAEAPSERVLAELTEQSADAAEFLNRLWNAGSFSGRLFVINHLLRQSDDASLGNQMEAVLEEAVSDADLEVRDGAFTLLSHQKHPALGARLRQQLDDADPAARVLGLQHLARSANSNAVAVAARLLDDSDPRVIVAAGTLLKRVTGQDYGLKVTQALPMFAWKADAPTPVTDWEAVNRGREGWRAWWRSHREEFPAAEAAPGHSHRCPARPVPDFALEDAEGRKARLSSFRGKAVLLTFWNPTNQLSFVDEPTLLALRQRRAAELEILAVVVAPADWPQASCGDHAEDHGSDQPSEHEHALAHHPKPASDPAKARAEARALADELGVRHPVLLDPKGTLAVRFGVQDLPTYVLIDAEGNLRRRFAGSRAATVFDAMVSEAVTPLEVRARAP